MDSIADDEKCPLVQFNALMPGACELGGPGEIGGYAPPGKQFSQLYSL